MASDDVAADAVSDGVVEGADESNSDFLDEWVSKDPGGDQEESEESEESSEASTRTTRPKKDPPKESKKAPPKAPVPYDPDARVTVKVDGEEQEITLDQAVREWRRRSAADKRFQEASAIRKDAEAKLAKLKDSPWDVLKELGFDPNKLASERILAQIEEERLATENPAELERRKAQLELESLKAELLSKQKEQEELLSKQRRAEHQKRYDESFSKALQEQHVPATPYTVGRMADILARNLREDPRFDATPKELAMLVMEDISKEVEFVLSKATPDMILRMISSENLKKIREADLTRVKGPTYKPLKAAGSEPAAPRRRRQSYRDPDDAQAALDDWANG